MKYFACNQLSIYRKSPSNEKKASAIPLLPLSGTLNNSYNFSTLNNSVKNRQCRDYSFNRKSYIPIEQTNLIMKEQPKTNESIQIKSPVLYTKIGRFNKESEIPIPPEFFKSNKKPTIDTECVNEYFKQQNYKEISPFR